MRVRGEVEYAVPPLADPDAVALFCTRSGFDPSEAIAELCRRLDNMPLAVELAAARTKVLSPAQILERLSERLDLLKGGRDADARQRTLRATIEWSHDLLSPEEKTLFARLAVFAGGCTLDSAGAIAGADLDTIESLVDKSLVRHTGERFWMLETIRTYAIDRLEQTGEADEISGAHAQHYLALAELDAPHLTGRFSKQWVDRQESEHDNHRAAYEWLESRGRTQEVLRLAGSLTEFWQLRGHTMEGLRRLEAALRADGSPTPARGQALQGAADLAGTIGDVAKDKHYLEQALALRQELGNDRGVALALWGLGYIAFEEGDVVLGMRTLEESVATLRAIGDEHHILHVTRTIAWGHHRLGDLDRARALHEDNLKLARARGDRLAMAGIMGSLSAIAVDQGRIRDAISLMRENDAILRDLRDFMGISENLCRMAKTLNVAGRAALAAQVHGCFEALADEAGGAESWVLRESKETLNALREQLDEETLEEARAIGRRLSVEDAMALGFDSGL